MAARLLTPSQPVGSGSAACEEEAGSCRSAIAGSRMAAATSLIGVM